MKATKNLLICGFTLVLILGCVTPRAVFEVEEGINLNAYKYVHIAPLKYPDRREDIYGVRRRVEAAFVKLGLKSLNTLEAGQLSRDEGLRYLFCTIHHFHTPDDFGGTYATVKIDMYDITRHKVYSGEGIYQGLMVSDDLRGATDEALQGFLERYTGFDPSLQPVALSRIHKKFGTWETIEKTRGDLEFYFEDNLERLDPIEGIWTSDNNEYQVGIFRDNQNPNREFVAIILRSENPLWFPKQVKIEFEETVYTGIYTTTYYLSDRSKQGTTAHINERGLLEMELRNPADGTPLKTTFIKNLPPETERTALAPPKQPSSKPSSNGSGFLLTKSGLVVTNYHVVVGAKRISVGFPSKEAEYGATVILKDTTNDLVILKIENFQYSKLFKSDIPFSVGHSMDVRVGQDVFTIGYPMSTVLGISPKFAGGSISSVYGIQDDPRLFQISVPIQPGNSGGPLFNSNGELIGILLASLNARYFYENVDIIPQNVNFAIKSDYLRNIVSLLPEGEEICKRKTKLAGKRVENLVELINPFVVNIVAQ